jgi:hypothetical protein
MAAHEGYQRMRANYRQLLLGSQGDLQQEGEIARLSDTGVRSIYNYNGAN